MLDTSCEKMSNCMRWVIVVPTAALIFALAYLIFCFSCMMMHSMMYTHTTQISSGSGSVAVNAAVNAVDYRVDSVSNFLDQEQNEMNIQMNKVDAKLKLAKADPKKFMEQDPQTAITGLTAATQGMKNHSIQITEQQKNMKALKEELAQLKQALNKSPSTEKSQ